MTTTAATSPSTTTTSTTSTDESPTLHDNGTSSNESASQIDITKHQHDHESDCQRSQQDESKKSNPLPADPRAEREQSTNSPDAQATGSTNNNVSLISQPAPTSSSSSSSSASTPPPISTQQPSSGSPVSKDGSTDAKHNQSPSSQNQSTTNSTSNEQKRPMNAFLLFCKRQRSLVREKHPNLENRGITKILGDWWTNLDKEQKSQYTDLARQHKEAFMKANPDFKWCKTPNVSNINNNTSSANDGCPNNQPSEQKHQLTQSLPQSQMLSHQQNNLQNNHLAPATNVDLLSLQSIQNHTELMQNHSTNYFGMNASKSHQLEAPKPPKKRFLERNDSIYTSRDNGSSSSHLDTGPQITETVSCFSPQQDILERVIDQAFSKNSDSSSSKPSGISNLCKSFDRNPANLTICLSKNSNNQLPFSKTASTISAPSSSNLMNVDEPVDFSMCRTINTTKQQLIETMVEKLFPKPSGDSQKSFSNPNGTESNFKMYSGPPAKRDKSDAT